MRVLHVFTVSVTRNGITMYALERLEGLRRAGVEADFACTNEVEPGLRAQIERQGARVFTIAQKRPGAGYVRALAALVRREKYDVVHAHGNSSSMFFEMLAAALGGCRARVVHSHNTTCGHIRQDRRLRPLFYRSYTAAAACGTDAGRWLFEDRPFTVLPNAVDTRRFAFDPAVRAQTRALLGVCDDAWLLGHVGRFNRQKNHLFLLDAFEGLLKLRPEARLVLLGDGPMEQEVRARAEKLGGRVIFTGSVPDPQRYLTAMDAMALPSLFEGFPTVLLEWQCAGLPTLVSDRVTREAALMDWVRFMPLEQGADAWARGLCELPRLDRASASAQAARLLGERGHALEDAADVLARFYQGIAPRPRA